LFIQILHIDISFKLYTAIAILAEYSVFHTNEILAKKLTDLGSSSKWAAIKEAVSQLDIEKKTFKSKDNRNRLQKSILQIVLANRLVSNMDFILRVVSQFHLQA
jgi:hypothetical protein